MNTRRWFAAVFGSFLGLCLLKFINPPIFEKFVAEPTNIYEFIFGGSWPILWAYSILALLALSGVAFLSHKPQVPRGLVALLLAWLLWQFVAATHSVSVELSKLTVKHFVACVGCFSVGLLVLGKSKSLGIFWVGLLLCLAIVLYAGWEQHFGGLEETRRYFFMYIYPTMKEVPPDYLKKMSSTRIFSTLFYPNALAGALLLFLPPAMAVLLEFKRMTLPARSFLAAIIAIAGVGCLFWSGSKGGWLLMLLLLLVVSFRLPIQRRIKILMVALLLLMGLAGFFARYLGFFQKGATSVSARFDYWHAAVKITSDHPFFGTGPGTFLIPYDQIRRPGSEPARLVHNDYLEQASDSGLPGFLTYTLFMLGALFWIGRKLFFLPEPSAGISQIPHPGSLKSRWNSLCLATSSMEWEAFSVWLGVLGWACQSLMEFSLYMPSLAWPAFTFLGWLISSALHDPAGKPVDKKH